MKEQIFTLAKTLLFSFFPDGERSYTRRPGAGTHRRLAREAAYRKAQDARLKDADTAHFPEIPTRQLCRQADRRGWNMTCYSRT